MMGDSHSLALVLGPTFEHWRRGARRQIRFLGDADGTIPNKALSLSPLAARCVYWVFILKAPGFSPLAVPHTVTPTSQPQPRYHMIADIPSLSAFPFVNIHLFYPLVVKGFWGHLSTRTADFRGLGEAGGREIFLKGFRSDHTQRHPKIHPKIHHV
jgi:hypothetical protein